jgi:hypothetical protein
LIDIVDQTENQLKALYQTRKRNESLAEHFTKKLRRNEEMRENKEMFRKLFLTFQCSFKRLAEKKIKR